MAGKSVFLLEWDLRQLLGTTERSRHGSTAGYLSLDQEAHACMGQQMQLLWNEMQVSHRLTLSQEFNSLRQRSGLVTRALETELC